MTSPSEFGAPLTLIHIRFTPIRPRTCYTACQNSPTNAIANYQDRYRFSGWPCRSNFQNNDGRKMSISRHCSTSKYVPSWL